MGKKVKILGVLLALTMTTSLFSACGSKSNNSQAGNPSSTGTASTTPKNISILSITFTGAPAAADEPTIKALEKLTGYNIKIEYLLNSNYEDQLNTRMAAQNLPALVAITGKTASVISNCRAGAFWDITNVYKNYPNLAQANDIVMNNISIDGKVYGIYRARPLGRNGISLRKDWLDNLGLKEPKTLDDLYNVLKAFTYNDPDKNGKNDTYGMTWSKFYGPLDQLNVAFGGYNGYGVGSDGKLAPDFTTDAYMKALDYEKKLYTDGLVNKDFAALQTSDWTKDFQNGKSGLHIDVSDQGYRYQQYFDKNNIKGTVEVIPMPAGPDGKIHALPTPGNAGFVAISKNGAPKESDMKDALNFLDKTNSKEAQNLLNFGVQGVHYDLNAQGEVVVKVFDKDPREGLNQFMTNVIDGLLLPQHQIDVQKQSDQVQKDNLKYVVPNPALPLTSNTYAEKGSQLDQIISDARVKYVVGQLDQAGFKAAVNQWYTQGGQKVVDEYNTAYQASKKK